MLKATFHKFRPAREVKGGSGGTQNVPALVFKVAVVRTDLAQGLAESVLALAYHSRLEQSRLTSYSRFLYTHDAFMYVRVLTF